MAASPRQPSLDAIVETLLGPSADASSVAADAALAMARLAPHRREQLERFLRLLENPAFLLAATGRFRAFSAAKPASREAILRALADNPSAALRSGFAALKRLVLFLAYARSEPNAPNPRWPAVGYPGPRNDRPLERSGLTLTPAQPGRLEADVVVVGSGAGGGVAAAVFAQAGYRTIVLEAGPAADDVAHEQREAAAVASLYLESGLAATTDLSVLLLAGACVGGGTTVNWSTSLRLGERVMREWTERSGVAAFPSEMESAYAAVESRLSLATVEEHNANNAVIVRGSERLGWPSAPLPRNASGCGPGCGYCGFGCAYGNKRDTASTFLLDAVRAGAAVIANARVERAIVRKRRACGVEATLEGLPGAPKLTVVAPLVVLAAGALRTPGLLARSGIRSPHLGRHLKLHPVAAVGAEFDEPIEPWSGAIQSAVCTRTIDDGSGWGTVIECAPAHPGLAAMGIPWRSAEQHARDMARLRHTAVLIALRRDAGEGSVSLDGRNDVRYRLDGRDEQGLREGLVAAAALAFAAGARRVSTFHAAPIIADRESGALAGFARAVLRHPLGANRSILFSAHQMGSARMSADPRDGVIGSDGAVHGYNGLLVVDAAAFPSASGVNPMLTIMALSHRAARRWLHSR